MAHLDVENSVVVMLDIGETFIPCALILQVVHAQNVYDHPVDDLFLAISLSMERCGLSEPGDQHQLETGPKRIEELVVSI